MYTEPEFCKPTNEGAGANDQPCPGKNEIRSYLRGVGNNYYPGQWVSNFVGVIFVSVKLYFCNVLFIVTFKNKISVEDYDVVKVQGQPPSLAK